MQKSNCLDIHWLITYTAENYEKQSMERISRVNLNISSHKSIWLLAWPVMIGQTLLTMLQIVDMFWIGKLGPSPVAGVAIAGSMNYQMLKCQIMIIH